MWGSVQLKPHYLKGRLRSITIDLGSWGIPLDSSASVPIGSVAHRGRTTPVTLRTIPPGPVVHLVSWRCPSNPRPVSTSTARYALHPKSRSRLQTRCGEKISIKSSCGSVSEWGYFVLAHLRVRVLSVTTTGCQGILLRHAPVALTGDTEIIPTLVRGPAHAAVDLADGVQTQGPPRPPSLRTKHPFCAHVCPTCFTSGSPDAPR